MLHLVQLPAEPSKGHLLLTVQTEGAPSFCKGSEFVFKKCKRNGVLLAITIFDLRWKLSLDNAAQL